ncbi:MAG TPA: DNA polymerase ligase N-terminal domain-containing protein [Vicinamibacterales bacterium]|nr:DNA polymerase ligase N-terminal domain-containing protein [Vicinamibacterales bacterium]
MALEKYREKRNFKESPEPAGDTKLAAERARKTKGVKPRFFCVQKHLASHLHYDFRLEHEGVLLSWAVPKGPALDPATKRLAMMVEDHPIEYGTFEGVIPSGYGAGIVMLWDQGTWTPEVDDVDAALKKGDLKFTLNGYKLKGSWVLVRTKGKWAGGSDRSWLLIKHRDDWAGDVDITEFAPLSVKSKGDFADILAADNPDIWISHRPASGGEAGAMFEKIIRRALEMRQRSMGAKGSMGSGGKRSVGSRGSGKGSKGSVIEKTKISTKGPATRKTVRTARTNRTARARRTAKNT